ncbi:aspartate kinase [Anaerolineae bacterium CFX9]|nr:aspartate kinase [Anaerolineae bacterium CFX9]
MSTLIMKFGGTAVGMTTGLTQVLSIVMNEQERWDQLVLVVSALEGVTDALFEAAHLAELDRGRAYRRIVATLRTRHLALIEHLPLGANERSALQADIDRLLFDMLDICQSLADQSIPEANRPEAVDAIIGVGERLSARIVAALLRQNGLRGVALDATDLIITDNVYGNATPNMAQTRERISRVLAPMLERRIIPVVTGFIGSTDAGKPTTLGRGGSDYTASILGACMDADEVWIWTDVDGMMTTDPRDVSDAQVIPSLTYSEAAELAYFGARVLHSRMIGPLRDSNIPLRVRNVFKPLGSGTLISRTPGGKSPSILAVTTISGVRCVSRHSGPLAKLAGMVDAVLYDLSGSHVEVMISAQSSSHSFVGFVIPTNAGPDAHHAVQAALAEAFREDSGNEWSVLPLTFITAVGSQIGHARTSSSILAALDGIPVLGLAQGPSGCHFTVAVDPRDAEAALQRLHQLVIARLSEADQ